MFNCKTAKIIMSLPRLLLACTNTCADTLTNMIEFVRKHGPNRKLDKRNSKIEKKK